MRLNRTPAKAAYVRHEKGILFKGAYFPQKLTPKSYINRIPVMAPILAPILGVHFFGGVPPSKMGQFAPFLATIQAISKTCVFLFNKRSEGCFVSDAPPLVLAPTIFIIALNMWFVSWESTPAHVKASKRGAKLYPRGDY
jgi:hypothetical protein